MTEKDFKDIEITLKGPLIKLRTIINEINVTQIPNVLFELNDRDSSYTTSTSIISGDLLTTEHVNNPLQMTSDETLNEVQSQLLNIEEESVEEVDCKEAVNSEPIESPKTIGTETQIKSKQRYCRCTNEDKGKIQFIDIPIRNWIQELDRISKSEPKLENVLDAGLQIDHAKQLCVAKFICKKMTKIWNSLYPPHCFKIKVAQELVKVFPALQSSLPGHPNRYEHWSDGSNGLMERHLKYKRTLIDENARKNKSRKKQNLTFTISPDLSESEIYEMKIERLEILSRNEINKNEICKLMDETRQVRQQQLHATISAKESLSLVAILRRFPKFKDYNGLLIKNEYENLLGADEKNFETVFPEHAQVIINYLKSCDTNKLSKLLSITDDDLKAITVLPEILSDIEMEEKKGKKRKRNEPDIPHPL